jgi:hypothetical protein
VGLYATCEIVTGRRFFGSYWEGLDIFTEIERRLRFEGDDDSPGLARGRAAIERAGGLPLLALALGSIRLAGTPSRSEVDPAGANGASWRDDRHVACNLFLAGGGYKPAGREPVADLAWLLTDRHDGSIWTVVCEQLSQLSDPMLVPPLRPLYRYPEACALAVCLRLAPLERDPAQDRLSGLRDFVAGLPRPLLARTALLGLRLTSTEHPGLPERASDQEHALVEAACFVSRIVPGPLPSQPAGPAAAVTPLVPPGLDGPPEFERALSRIAEHGSGPIEVDLLQCDRRWIDRWASLRAALDSALLALALGRGARVRRVVLFDLPSDADRGSTRLHYRWSGSLAAAVGCFEQPDDSDAGASRYQVRQLILPRAGSTVELPGDCIVVRDGAAGGRGDGVEAGEGFEAVWELADRSGRAPERGFGLIELGGNQQRWGSAGEPAGALAEL